MTQMPSHPPYQPAGSNSGTSGMAVASMVLGIISLVFFCILKLSIPAAILAIVLGFMARAQIQPGQGGKGMALAGIICGIISILIGVILIAGIISLVHFGGPAFQRFMNQVQTQMQQYQQQHNGGATTSPAGTFLHLPAMLIRTAYHFC